MPTEVEVKFLADGREPLESLVRDSHLAGAHLGPPATVTEVDAYLDTADHRLRAAGWAARHRDRGLGPIISLKGPAGGERGAIHRRPELEAPATESLDPDDWPASDARDRLVELAAGAALMERLRLVQQRTERAVEVDGGRIGTLSLDAVTILDAGGTRRGTILTVELEVIGEDETQLTPLADALAARPGLVPDPRSKLDHALAALGEE